MTELDATVAICTHNGGDRLKGVLESLRIQSSDTYKWEVLIVNNASDDDTQTTIDTLVRDFPVPIRSVIEEQLGITHARHRAALESKGRILCFLDDDNHAEKDFVVNALRFMEKHPQCGIVGGKIKAIWESEPTDLVLRVSKHALAICDRGEKCFCYQGQYEGPVTAGMCIRTALLRKIYKSTNILKKIKSRRGNNLDCGEDIAFSVIAKQLGAQCWYEPALKITHFIPKRRMGKSYLLRLYRGFGRGQAAVRKLVDWKARNPFFCVVDCIEGFRKMVL